VHLLGIRLFAIRSRFDLAENFSGFVGGGIEIEYFDGFVLGVRHDGPTNGGTRNDGGPALFRSEAAKRNVSIFRGVIGQ